MTPLNSWLTPLTLTKYSFCLSRNSLSQLCLSLSSEPPPCSFEPSVLVSPPALNVPSLPTPLYTITPNRSPSLHPLLPTLSFRGTPPTPSKVPGLFSGFEFFINGFSRFCLKNFYIFFYWFLFLFFIRRTVV
jgi:hypothetical protein